MYCVHCGAKIEGTPKFCYQCGQPLPQPEETQVPPAQAKVRPAEGLQHPPAGTGAAPTPAAAGRPKARRPRRMPLWLRVLLIVFVVLFSVAFVAVGTFAGMGLHRTNQLVKIVPDDTPVFISFSPTLLGLPQLRYVDNLRKAGGVFAAIPAALGAGDWVGAGEELDLDVDLQRDVLPWIGREVSLAVVRDADEQPQLLLAAATRSKRESDAFLSQLRSQLEDSDVEFRATVYRDVQITEVADPGPSLAYATVKHMVVVASDMDVLRDTIDRAAVKPASSLYDHRAYQAALDDLPASRLGYVYIDVSDLPEDLSEGLDDVAPFLAARFAAIESFAAAPQLSKDGLHIAHVTRYSLNKLPADLERELQRAADLDPLIALAPEGSIAYLSGHNLPSTFGTFDADLETALEDLLGQGPGASSVDDLLSALSGTYACIVSADSGGLLAELGMPAAGVLLLFHVEDRGLAEDILDDLAARIAEDGYLELRRDEINGATVWLLEEPFSEVTIGFGFMDDVMLLASSREMIAAATDSREGKLVDSRVFQAVTHGLPRRCRGQSYVDVQAALEVVYATLDKADREQFDEWVRPYVEPVLGIGIATEPMDKSGALRGTLYVHTTPQ